MNHTIENGKLICTMETRGAQLLSLMSRENKKEYIWQGNPSVWMWHAPVLFPVCGNFPSTGMKQHGFLRDLEHTYKGDGNFSFSTDGEEGYPYHVSAKTSFMLEGNTLVHRIEIINTDSKPIPYSVGFHTGLALSNAVLSFNRPNGRTFVANDVLLSKTVLVTGDVPTVIDCVDSSGKKLKWESQDYTTLALWAVDGHAKDYICIEPRIDTVPSGAKEPFARTLEPGKAASLEERITIIS